jgi:uncharacterized protein (DUF3820 family)
MARGNAELTKIVYKGKKDDYMVIIDLLEDYEKWKKDESIPLAQVLSGWKIFVTHKYASRPVLFLPDTRLLMFFDS